MEQKDVNFSQVNDMHISPHSFTFINNEALATLDEMFDQLWQLPADNFSCSCAAPVNARRTNYLLCGKINQNGSKSVQGSETYMKTLTPPILSQLQVEGKN